jgi:predicted metalloendopeptidase
VKPRLLTALTLSLMTAFATAADLPHRSPASIPNMDTSVRPQDDFFTYLNGSWMKTTEIPGDKSSWGTFAKLRDDTCRSCAADRKRRREKPRPAPRRKIADLYASFMDEEARPAGHPPLTGELNRIRALKDKKACPC